MGKYEPEEEYLIRIGKIKSPLFNPDLYNGFLSYPWGSSQDYEMHHPNKEYLFITANEIIKKYGLSKECLALLYRGYSNEYHYDERRFTDDDLNIANQLSRYSVCRTPTETAKANLNQIVLNKIMLVLEELRQIGIAKNKTPVYKQE